MKNGFMIDEINNAVILKIVVRCSVDVHDKLEHQECNKTDVCLMAYFKSSGNDQLKYRKIVNSVRFSMTLNVEQSRNRCRDISVFNKPLERVECYCHN